MEEELSHSPQNGRYEIIPVKVKGLSMAITPKVIV